MSSMRRESLRSYIMVSLSLSYSLMMHFCGIYVYSLMVFLSLEYLFNYMWFGTFFSYFCFVFSVYEGALGLSIFVSMIRSYGNDFFNSFMFSLC